MREDLEVKMRRYVKSTGTAVAYLGTVDAAAGFVPELRPITLMIHDWRFYLATDAKSRKAIELAKHPKATVLVHLRDAECSGYLRLTGIVKPTADLDRRQSVSRSTRYSIEKYWTSVGDPSLFFGEIMPD